MVFSSVSFLELKMFLVDLKLAQHISPFAHYWDKNTPQMHLLERRSCYRLRYGSSGGSSRQQEDETSVTLFPIYSTQVPSSWTDIAHVLGGSGGVSPEAPQGFPQSTLSKSCQGDSDNCYTCRKSYRKAFK